MQINETLDEYHRIESSNIKCQEDRDYEIKKLKKQIRIVFNDYTHEIRMKKFSELYEIYSLISFEDDDNELLGKLNFNEQDLDSIYAEYIDKPFMEDSKDINMWDIAASRDFFHLSNKSDYELTNKFTEVFDLPDKVDVNEVRSSYKMIGYMLEALWECIFQKNLTYLQSNNDSVNENRNKPCDEINKYYNKNWSLYILINYINIYLSQLEDEGKTSEKKFSDLTTDEKIDILSETSDLCVYMLDNCLFGDSQRKNSWSLKLPKMKISGDIQLPRVIATSNLISYIFECKSMKTIRRNKYYKDMEFSVQQIYRSILKNINIYDAMEAYLEANDNNYIVKYKNSSFYPKVVVLFILSIIQEVIKKALTQKGHNIFYKLSNKYRDSGMTEKAIFTKVEKDARSYMRIYHYLEDPRPITLTRKIDKLNEWLADLNKLRFGVLDEYLFNLAQILAVSYEEEIVTKIKINNKPRL